MKKAETAGPLLQEGFARPVSTMSAFIMSASIMSVSFSPADRRDEP